jgi:hypothetical protein
MSTGPPGIKGYGGGSGPKGSHIGDMDNMTMPTASGLPSTGFSALEGVFKDSSKMLSAVSPSMGFFSTADSNLMEPAQRSGQRKLTSMSAEMGSSRVQGAFAQSRSINTANGLDDRTRMAAIQASFFENGGDLLASTTKKKLGGPSTSSSRDRVSAHHAHLPEQSSYDSIEDQLRKSGSTLSANTVPIMLGTFQHPDFAGADPASVGIDMSGMSSEVEDATTRLLQAGQPMMSNSAPPDAFFQLSLALNPRVFENAPLTQTVKKNGAARQDATGYIGYPQDLRIPLSATADSFATPHAPYAQDMYLSDLLKKLEAGTVVPKTTVMHGSVGEGMPPGDQHLLDMSVHHPGDMVYQSMEEEWGGDADMMTVDGGRYPLQAQQKVPTAAR